MNCDARYSTLEGYSCDPNFLLACNEWTCAVNADFGVESVYLDSSVAFDRVRYALLLKKLHVWVVRDN